MRKKTYNNTSVVWLVAFIFLISFGYAFAGEPDRVTKVTASIIDETVVPGDQFANEGQTRNIDRFPENPESYLPMPLPDPTEFDEKDAVPLGDNRVISYDVATGEETIHKSETLSGNISLENWIEGNLGRGESLKAALEANSSADDISPKRFGNRVNRGSGARFFPWRMNVKVFMVMPNGNFVCSGALIGPRTVITAGHCVHQGRGGRFAISIVVVPGFYNGVRPFGSASSIRLQTWTGWARNSDFNHDIGLIKLNRAIARSTGWFGFGWATPPAFHLAQTWHNPGYPAAPPFTGAWMYYWFGRGDFFSGIQMGIFNRSFGGQSGSGGYRIVGTSRFIHMVLSNGNNVFTRFPIITQGKFNAIRVFWMSAPAAFDLEPMDVDVNLAASKMSYLVGNNSAQSWSGTVTANVYLSKNNNISTSDTLIQTHAFEADFGPNATVEVEVPSFAIPEDTLTGQYWIGVVLDFPDDNLNNNDSDGQDARQILMIK